MLDLPLPAGAAHGAPRISRLERQGYPVPLPFYHKALPNDKLSRALRAVFQIEHLRVFRCNALLTELFQFWHRIPQQPCAVTGNLTRHGLSLIHILVRGENVHLTLSEFRIVALLGKYAGKVLTYDYIIKELWGPRAGGDNQILRVNMANIRRKIEKNPAEPEYLFTEVGVGYRLAEGE